jgi:thiol-disulfide isomerase/thioredoxin
MKSTFFYSLILLLFLLGCSPSETQEYALPEPLPMETDHSALEQGIGKGQISPDFSVTTVEGEKLKLSQFTNEMPVLVYFWASWCPYCSRDFEAVKAVYPQYSGKIKFIAIDLDLGEDEELIRRYRDNKQLEGIDFSVGQRSILSDYAVKYTTTKYAIGRNGIIMYKGSGEFTEEQWKTLFGAMESG